MTYYEDKKTISMVRVETNTHEWLLRKANEKGIIVSNYTGQLLDELVAKWIPPEEDSNLDRQLFNDWLKFKQDHRRRERVYHAAALYYEDPDEEKADRLQRMCAAAGLDYAEVVQEVSNDPFSSIVAMSRDGTKFGDCLRWLPQEIVKRGGQVKVAPLRIAAHQKGFSNSLLNRVKRAVNSDMGTPYIESVKVGRGWAWVIRKEG